MHFHFEHYHYFEYGSLLVAIFCYKGLRRFSLQGFIPLLLTISLLETFGENYFVLGLKGPLPIYNIYFLLVTPLYFFIYRKMLLPARNERIIFDAICILSGIFLLLNVLFIQKIDQFDNHSASLTQVLNVIFSGLILVRLVTVETRQTLLYGEPYFWISASTMLFNLISFVLLGLLPFVIDHGLVVGNKTLHQIILPPASDVLYSIYSFAFILCQVRKTN